MSEKEIRKEKQRKLHDILGILCGVAVVLIGVISGIIAKNAPVDMETALANASHIGRETAGKVETMSGVTLLYASDWQEKYPEIYDSWMQNEENSEAINYLEEYPQLVTLYEPYGFSKFYSSARGHFYDVQDISETGRPHKTANCWTCKTPDFTHLVNETGVEAYSIAFEDVQVQEGISCYNCHANNVDKKELVVTHTYMIDAVGEDFDSIDAANLACGQCHVEYYFYPGTLATTLPHTSLESMSPDAILSYYNNDLLVDGEPFADYTNPRTGVRQIKVQHPEFETYLGEGTVHGGTYNCADCHMGTVVTDNGRKTYPNHYLTSPLDNEELIANECSSCHADLVAEVTAVQEKADARTREVADMLVDLTEKLAVIVEKGEMTDEQLAPIRSLARDAQFYWDFVFVENSNGAHNPTLTTNCLDKAAELAEEALGMLK
ncbi:MAG: ammonia-forming cytochrome c nitrite reductase subunit c552 [Oscillospiraceae bacterium]|nr:ammonia-forming cytochrome c nitrite reductase subunit c552 [Oscillospiraceae bacterium]